jgi:hypothetical protein
MNSGCRWARYSLKTAESQTGMGTEMSLSKAILKGFDTGNYKATVQLAGSHEVYLEEVTVARNLPAAEMVTGRKVAVVFFDAYNAKEAVVVAVYT